MTPRTTAVLMCGDTGVADGVAACTMGAFDP